MKITEQKEIENLLDKFTPLKYNAFNHIYDSNIAENIHYSERPTPKVELVHERGFIEGRSAFIEWEFVNGNGKAISIEIEL